MEKVSVIIPAYNAEKTICRCIDSLLNQTYENTELIIIDDGSADNTFAICERYKELDSRIRIIHQENQGVSAARNAGLKVATGEYVMFADCDDIVKSTYVSSYVEAIRNPAADIAIAGFTRVSIDGEEEYINPLSTGYFGDEIWEDIAIHFEIYGHPVNKIFRREIIEKNHLRFNTQMHSQEDLDFCLSVINYCNRVRIFNNNDYIYYYLEGKRVPPVWDYIRNQLKISRCAEIHKSLSSASDYAVNCRIQHLIYNWIYNAFYQGQLSYAVERYHQIVGLSEYLQVHTYVAGEAGRISKWTNEGKWKTISIYFVLRKAIKKLVGRGS